MQINWNWFEELRDRKVKSAREQRESVLKSLKEQEIRSLQGEYRRLLKEVAEDLKINWTPAYLVHDANIVRSRFCRVWRQVHAFNLFDTIKEEEFVRTTMLNLHSLSTHPNYEKNTIVLVYDSLGLGYPIEITLGFIILR